MLSYEVISDWIGEVLVALDEDPGGPGLEDDFGGEIVRVLDYLASDIRDGDGSTTATYSEIGYVLDLRRASVAAAVAWLVEGRFVAREAAGPAGYRYSIGARSGPDCGVIEPLPIEFDFPLFERQLLAYTETRR